MTTHATDTDSPQAEHIRNTERARLRAQVEGDIAQAEPLHSPEFHLIKPIGKPLSLKPTGTLMHGRPANVA